MPVPAGITSTALTVIIEVTPAINYITIPDSTLQFGKVVIIGVGVTTCVVNDIVLIKNRQYFKIAGSDYIYYACSNTDVLFIYVPV